MSELNFDHNHELMQEWKTEFEAFEGDKALFWAGKMSISIGALISAQPLNISSIIHLLGKVKEAYDWEIFSNLKKRS